MAITNKLITFNKLTSFETQLAQGNILETSIVFIKDAKKIWTKGTYFDCSGGGSSIPIIELPLTESSGTLNEDQSAILTNFPDMFIFEDSTGTSGEQEFLLFKKHAFTAGASYSYYCNVRNYSYHFFYNFRANLYSIDRRELALKSDIPNTDNFLQYLDPTLKTIAVNGLLGDDEMIYALPNSSIIESEDYDKILATRDEIGYTTEFSVADIEAVYGRGITKPINVQGLMSAIEANKPIIIPTNITDASQVGGNAVTMAKMENDGFIYLNVIVPYLDGVHKEYFIQIKITTAQLIKSGSNGSITLKELVAKTDLKTINGESILGSGDISIDTVVETTVNTAIQNAITNTLNKAV